MNESDAYKMIQSLGNYLKTDMVTQPDGSEEYKSHRAHPETTGFRW